MPRMELTEEEQALVKEHRRKNEVNAAFLKGVAWARQFVDQQIPPTLLNITQQVLEETLNHMEDTAKQVLTIQPRKK